VCLDQGVVAGDVVENVNVAKSRSSEGTQTVRRLQLYLSEAKLSSWNAVG